jgi:hypothetical protein
MTRLETSKAAWVAFLAVSLILFGIEAAWFLPEGSALLAAAAWSWVGCSCLILCWALIYSVAPFFRAVFWRSQDVAWYLIAFFIPVGLILFGIGGWKYTQISNECALQVQSGYFFFTETKDLGLFKMGFIGYPARQYLLAAVPSYLFGKGLVALRIGFGSLYLIGYVAFLRGTLGFLESRNSPRPMLVSSLTGALVSMGSYPLLYARLFEQTLVPIALAYLFLAGLLLLLSRPGPLPGLWVAWVLGLMPYSYTPSFGIWALAMVVVCYLAMRRSVGKRLPLAVCLAYGAVAFAACLATMAREHALAGRAAIGGFDGLLAVDWLFRLLAGFHATVGLEESLIPAPLLLGLVFILVHSVRTRDFRVPFVCAWAVGAVVMALALKGYCWRLPQFDIHRAMFIVPVLSLMLGLYLSEHWRALSGGDDRLLRGIIVSGILVMILNSAYLPFIRRTPRESSPFFATDEEEAAMLVWKTAGAGAKTVYVQPPFPPEYRFDDLLRYFSPDAKVVRTAPPEGEHLPGNLVVSFLSDDPATRLADFLVWHNNPRPFLKIRPE